MNTLSRGEYLCQGSRLCWRVQNKNMSAYISITPVKMKQNIHFVFLNYVYFKKSRYNSLIYKLPYSLIILPYLLIMTIIFYNKKKFFLEYRNNKVGLLAYRASNYSLFISSIAVDPHYRRLGFATFLLNYVKSIAKKMNKRYVELSVECFNYGAQKLYYNQGFKIYKFRENLFEKYFFMRVKIN